MWKWNKQYVMSVAQTGCPSVCLWKLKTSLCSVHEWYLLVLYYTTWLLLVCVFFLKNLFFKPGFTGHKVNDWCVYSFVSSELFLQLVIYMYSFCFAGTSTYIYSESVYMWSLHCFHQYKKQLYICDCLQRNKLK